MFAAKIQLLFELDNNADNSIGLGSANEDIFRTPLPSPHLREAAFVAHHKKGRRVVAAHEVVEVQRLPDDEAGAVEGVAGLELGVLALHHLKAAVAKMPEQHAAVGRPRNAHETIHRDLARIERTPQHHIGGLARLVVVGEEVVPVLETHTSGKDGERGETSGVVTLHVTPDALQSGHAKGLLATFLNHTREELEIRRGLHLAGDGLLHHLAKSQYVSIVRLHSA